MTLEDLIKIVGYLVLGIGSLAILSATWSTRRNEILRRQRDDLKLDLEEAERKRMHAEDLLEIMTHQNARLTAKVDWYERRYGLIPPSEFNVSRD